MKKYLISLVAFFSIFIFSNNVKAISSKKMIFDYDSDYLQNDVLTNTNISFINNLISYIDNSVNRSQFDYVILLNTSNYKSQYPVSIYFTQPYDNNNIMSVSSFVRSGWGGSFSFGKTGTLNDSGLYSTINYGNGAFPCQYYKFSSSDVSNNSFTVIDSFLQQPTFSTSQRTGIGYSFLGSVFNNYDMNGTYEGQDITLYSSNANGNYEGSNLFYYSSYTPKLSCWTDNSKKPYCRELDIIYNGETIHYSLGDDFPFYYDIDNPSVSVNKVIDLGDNSFGFYQDYVGLNLSSLSGVVDTLSVVCEQDRPFNNNYCFINYNDLINHNSDINVFNNYGVSFTQLFGSNTGYLLNDRYYLYSFRIQKPFVPQVGNLFINSLTSNSNQVDILGVYLQDGGSYTDYVIKFKISNSDYTSSTSLNDITVVFRDGLSSYFSTIPTSFNYSVYRSFKLQYFSTEPTMEQVNNFYNSNDLSSIDGVGSDNSFFTDNQFNTFGFAGIVTAPFRLLYAIEDYQSCSNIVLPFPHSNNSITLACVRNSIPSSINPLISILQIILSGFISYRIAVETLSIIKDMSSPDVANIEVVDL